MLNWWENLDNALAQVFNDKNNNNETLLHLASSIGYNRIVAKLLNIENIEKSSLDNSNNTPFYLAASNNHTDVAKTLIASGIPFDNSKGLTTLHYLAFSDNVNRSINTQEINAQDEKGRTPLHYAALTGNTEMIEFLLEQGNINPNLLDKDGCSPLHLAALKGHANVVDMLLTRGVDINTQDEKGRTPLHHAVLPPNGSINTARILLQKGANPNLQDKEGNTPLHIVAKEYTYNPQMIELLVNHGSDIYVKNNEQCLAEEYGSYSILELRTIRALKEYLGNGVRLTFCTDNDKLNITVAKDEDKMNRIEYLLDQYSCGSYSFMDAIKRKFRYLPSLEYIPPSETADNSSLTFAADIPNEQARTTQFAYIQNNIQATPAPKTWIETVSDPLSPCRATVGFQDRASLLRTSLLGATMQR